ncbi:hypothetical protein [Paenibacillus dendrobii]|uniref:hypothetical protein n=1 Tax=Paenibacillus dendrobii TaxID=2691084 RepID=UPI001F28C477|nr:hypothetical protein [Paenibacillus dendrobii]
MALRGQTMLPSLLSPNFFDLFLIGEIRSQRRTLTLVRIRLSSPLVFCLFIMKPLPLQLLALDVRSSSKVNVLLTDGAPLVHH